MYVIHTLNELKFLLISTSIYTMTTFTSHLSHLLETGQNLPSYWSILVSVVT